MGDPRLMFGENGDDGALNFLLQELVKADLKPTAANYSVSTLTTENIQVHPC